MTGSITERSEGDFLHGELIVNIYIEIFVLLDVCPLYNKEQWCKYGSVFIVTRYSRDNLAVIVIKYNVRLTCGLRSTVNTEVNSTDSNFNDNSAGWSTISGTIVPILVNNSTNDFVWATQLTLNSHLNLTLF